MVRFNGQQDLEQDFHAFMLKSFKFVLCHRQSWIFKKRTNMSVRFGIYLKPRINKLANRNPRTKKLGMLFSSSPLSKELNYVLYISWLLDWRKSCEPSTLALEDMKIESLTLFWYLPMGSSHLVACLKHFEMILITIRGSLVALSCPF